MQTVEQLIARAESAEREVDAQCLLNAKGSEREAVLLGRVDRMAKEGLNLRADLDAIKAIRNEETARAERAEAELKAYRDAVDAQPWASDLPIRVLLDQITSELLTTRNLLMSDADAQVELAAERAIVSRIWTQLGSPTHEQLKGRSIYDLIDEMRAELAEQQWLKESSVKRAKELAEELDAERERVRVLRQTLESLARRAPIMGSVGDYREGQLDALEVVSDVANDALAATKETA